MAQARLAKEVLAEIPDQFVSYMRTSGIAPGNIRRFLPNDHLFPKGAWHGSRQPMAPTAPGPETGSWQQTPVANSTPGTSYTQPPYPSQGVEPMWTQKTNEPPLPYTPVT